MKKIVFIFIITVLSTMGNVHAQNVKTISGEAVYYGDATDSPADAKRKALEAARINALAREFGTTVSQTTVQRDRIDSEGERSYFSALSASEVRGEWIADEGEPRYKVELDADGHYVVRCSVSIKARALSNKAVDFKASVLRNGQTLRHADTDFRSGDQMYLYFQSPVDGYIAVYLVLEDDQVMSLLPYKSSASGKAVVRHNKEYILFDETNADKGHGVPDELLLQTDQIVEHNQLYVLFTPNEFTKAMDHDAGAQLPRSLSYKEFASWLAKVRRNDDEMGMKVFNIVITNN